jgi:hypothetical protein
MKLPPGPGTESADAPAPETGVLAGPQLSFCSVDEFLREKPRLTCERRVDAQSSMWWAADWRCYPEAISRLDSLWRT